MRFSPKLNRFFGLGVAGLLIVFWAGQARAQEEEYLRIYSLIEQADSLTAKQPQAALAKYREAQGALLSLQRNYRDWNAKAVAYRLNYLAEKVASLSDKVSRGAGSGG